jgi:uncharacterized membrane protein YraQ (UPF0718 family)
VDDSIFLKIMHATWDTMQEAAPWLLFGFFIAGVIHVFLPISWVNKLLKKPGFASIFRASVIGAPIPLCSCGIIPVMKSLRERGVSKGAAASFMTSTPEIGIGAFFLTQGLLGMVFAVFRVIAAILSAILVGVMVESIKDEGSAPEKDLKETSEGKKSCCSDTSHVCGEIEDPLAETDSFFHVLKETLYFAFYTLPKDLSVLLIVGFLVSGVFAALLPAEFLTETVSEPILQMILALLVSLPLYICATSSTPIAAVLFSKGLSVGAVLVFLLAGAATNVSTVLAAKKEFGLRGAVYYVGSIVFVSLMFGLIIEYGIPHNGGFIPHPSSHVHDHHDHHHGGLFSQVAAFFMLFLLVYPLLPLRKSRSA